MTQVPVQALINAHIAQGDLVEALGATLSRIEWLEDRVTQAERLCDEVLEDAIRAKAALKSYVIVEMLDSAFTAIDKRVKKIEWERNS
jgi:hypothetical protein